MHGEEDHVVFVFLDSYKWVRPICISLKQDPNNEERLERCDGPEEEAEYRAVRGDGDEHAAVDREEGRGGRDGDVKVAVRVGRGAPDGRQAVVARERDVRTGQGRPENRG